MSKISSFFGTRSSFAHNLHLRAYDIYIEKSKPEKSLEHPNCLKWSHDQKIVIRAKKMGFERVVVSACLVSARFLSQVLSVS